MRNIRSDIQVILNRIYEYAALWFGLILLGAGSLAWSLIAMPLYHVLPKSIANFLGRRVISSGFHLYLQSLAWCGACHFDIKALDSLRGQGPLIIAPNHPCLLDALMVLSRLPNTVCIMKSSILNNIFFGAGARMAGYISNDAQLSMVRQAIVEIKKGSFLLIFPEGTRTTRWPINQCQGTAALIAYQANVSIQTVFIETNSPYLTKGWSLFRTPVMPVTYRIHLGRRFEPTANIRAATSELEHYFSVALHGMPNFSPTAALYSTDVKTIVSI